MKKPYKPLLLALTALTITACAPTPQSPSQPAGSGSSAAPADSAGESAPSKSSGADGELEKLKDDYSAMSSEYEAYRESVESEAAVRASVESSAAERQAAIDKIGYETGVTYSQLLNASEVFRGIRVQFKGTVLQVLRQSETIAVRLAVDGDPDQVIYGEYDSNELPVRIAKDDQIAVYGTAAGMFQYTSDTGKDYTLPAISIEAVNP